MTQSISLTLQQPLLAVVRFPAGSGMPWWAATSSFLSFTRTASEDSLVCEEVRVPEGLAAQKGFRALRVDGKLPFHLTGVLASLASPLANADVPIFVVSTHDTDYLLVPETKLTRAAAALREAGHSVSE
jgi:uncharacterized protein